MDNPTYDTEFIKGFNEGYLIAKHLPDLADQLSNLKGNSNRLLGLKGGCQEFILEAERKKLSEKDKMSMDQRIQKEQDFDKV